MDMVGTGLGDAAGAVCRGAATVVATAPGKRRNGNWAKVIV